MMPTALERLKLALEKLPRYKEVKERNSRDKEEDKPAVEARKKRDRLTLAVINETISPSIIALLNTINTDYLKGNGKIDIYSRIEAGPVVTISLLWSTKPSEGAEESYDDIGRIFVTILGPRPSTTYQPAIENSTFVVVCGNSLSTIGFKQPSYIRGGTAEPYWNQENYVTTSQPDWHDRVVDALVENLIVDSLEQ